MLLLKLFVKALDDEPSLLGGLPELDASFQMLVRLQTADARQFADLIDHPQLGNWLAYTLRCLAGRSAKDVPLEVEFGQIHALALAAAATIGEPFSTRVPLRDGRIMVPRHGMAYFSGCGPWDVAEAWTVDGQIHVRHGGRLVKGAKDVDSEGWWALRRVRVGVDPVLEVWLDDLDPMRDLADPVPPSRLSDEEVKRWTDLLGEAWEILSVQHPDVAESMAIGVISLAPLPTGDGWDTRSASSGDAFGAVMCSRPSDATTLAVCLAHEFAHIRLGGLLHLLRFFDERCVDSCLYAPWRDDPRPLGGLIQGVYAFTNIAAFWRRYRGTVTLDERKLADFEYAYAKTQVEKGLTIARAAAGLTEIGDKFLAGLAAEVDRWEDEPVLEEPMRLARLVADGHRIGWRLRHCQPSPEEVSTLVSAWEQGSAGPLPVAASVTYPDPAMRQWSQGRLGLARRRLEAPQQCQDVLEEPWGATLLDADLALIAGDCETAAKGFVDQITFNPQNEVLDNAWTGLALALGAHPADRAHAALSARPELVKAFYREALVRAGKPLSPLDVARWIGSAIELA